MSEQPTAEELKAFDDFAEVLRNFPKSLYISVDDSEEDCGVYVYKRVKPGMSKAIGSIQNKYIVEVF